jgi:hypothetical protein
MTTFLEEFESFRKPEQIMRDALLTETAVLMLHLTEDQIAFLHRIYPDLKSLPREKLAQAIDLMHRTITKNRVGRGGNK